MTLVEVVAVVVVLAIATMTMLAASRPFSETHQRRAAVGAMRESLDRARLLAASDGDGADLRCAPSAMVASARVRPLPEIRTPLPSGWSAALRIEAPYARRVDAHDRSDVLNIDAAGCSPDAEIVLRSPTASVWLTLLGLSGELHEQAAGDGAAP